jgi:hypothetical protein
MSQFAAQTSVSSETSRGEIERTLQRYGADAFMYGWEAGRAIVQFRAHNRYVKFELPMPNRNDYLFTPAKRQRRSEADVDKAFDQAQRQRWRALNLVIKAKLEAVETGITTFESEFLAHTLLPNGQTVGQWTEPQITEAYDTGQMPKLLPEVTG